MHAEEILSILVRILYNLGYHMATIFHTVYTKNRIKGFRAVNNPSPKPKQFGNGGKSMEFAPIQSWLMGNLRLPFHSGPSTLLLWGPLERRSG